jgi:hypothetical protein
VSEQNEQPITEFTIEVLRKADGDDYSGEYLRGFGYTMPVNSDDGRFEIEGLPAGTYTVLVQPKDEIAYDYWRWHDCNVGQTRATELKIEVTKKKAFYGRVLFEDGGPAIVKPEPYAGAKTRIKEEGLALPFPGFGELGEDGYFTLWLREESIRRLGAGETRLSITVPITHPGVERGAIEEVGEFPYEALSADKGEAGVVRIERRAGGYAVARPEPETGLGERATESSVATRTWTARELIEKIIESEKKIRSWEVHATYMPPDSNGFKTVYDQGYDQGKKYEEGTHFEPPGELAIINAPSGSEPVYGPACTHEFKHVFDGTKCYKFEDDISFSVGEGKASVKHKGKRGEIHRGMDYSWGPQMLLGYWVNGLFRECGGDTFGEVLRCHIKNVRIREVPESINGHSCTVIEVLGIRDYVPEGIFAVDDLHIWIDTERDFRPLRIETYRFQEQYEGRTLTGMRKEFVRRFETTKLKNIDGTWFPTAGECNGYTVKIDESSIRLNKKIDPEKFAPIEFGPGCRVSDTFSNAWYTVGGFDDPSYEPKTPVEKLLKELVYREVDVDPELTEELIGVMVREIRSVGVIGPDQEKWMAAARGLVLIGRPAVPELTAELKRTLKEKPKTDREMIRHGERLRYRS